MAGAVAALSTLRLRSGFKTSSGQGRIDYPCHKKFGSNTREPITMRSIGAISFGILPCPKPMVGGAATDGDGEIRQQSGQLLSTHTKGLGSTVAQTQNVRMRGLVPHTPPGMRDNYSSDLTDKEWAVLELLIPRSHKLGRPPRYLKREITKLHFIASSIRSNSDDLWQ